VTVGARLPQRRDLAHAREVALERVRARADRRRARVRARLRESRDAFAEACGEVHDGRSSP